ncbi:hypothetical protein CIB84_014785 [Bambusicola thoracicus]|uniref:Uncharacterized protein n=1 Tax=Bambusicola thoracicus TaxID=9083 RepID=A0A2P4SBH4_BAMTH|nr:hypothetical protein CIB84_014785 [Bambusicola thoracicus]
MPCSDTLPEVSATVSKDTDLRRKKHSLRLYLTMASHTAGNSPQLLTEEDLHHLLTIQFYVS